MDFSNFKNPPIEYRPAPFWAVNDKLEPKETARQIDDMIDSGFSGGFFHSRSGLVTDYLGQEWFDALDSAIAAAKEKHGHVWLYDEDLWPSGNAGGQISALKDEYRATLLEAEFVPIGQEALPDGEDEPQAAYILIGRCGASVESIEKVDFAEARLRTNCERLLFRRHYLPKTAWWGGESFANLLHPGVTKEFIQRTHELYKSKIGHEFGKTVPGIFTDEPNLRTNKPGQNSIPWWEGIPEVYSKWHGRVFWNDLPYLFVDAPQSRKVRLLVHRTILRQFIEGYTKPIYDWCDANGLPLTGHFLEESSFEWQILATYGSIMTHYRYQHIPGIDHLLKQVDWGLPLLFSGKQVASAARQLGKDKVLVETFAASRHTNTFEDFKWLGDADMVLGATFFCPHLSLYSMRGRRKRDYPPNWNYQQTYWPDISAINDYFARVGYVLSSTKPSPDLLILHPIEGATATRRIGLAPLRVNSMDSTPRMAPSDLPAEDLSEINKLDATFRRTLDAVLNAGYDCDLGDEGYIEDLGSVEGNRLKIGEMTYQMVVVPPSQTWRPSTFDILKRFAANGGKLIFTGALPTELDCEDAAQKWRELSEMPGVASVPSSAIQLQRALEETLPATYSVRGTDGKPVRKLYLQHRIDGDTEIFFIVNSDRESPRDCVLTLNNRTDVPMAVWNATIGTRTAVTPLQVGNELRYQFHLEAAGSTIIVAGLNACDAECTQEVRCSKIAKATQLPKTWQFTRSEENVLVMDRISASLDGGKTWSVEDAEYRIRKMLADHFKTSEALEWQPWVAVRKGIFDGKGGEVVLRYKFQNSLPQIKNACLVMEDMQKGVVTVNGQKLDTSNASWHWDRTWPKVDIADLIFQGENVIDFRFDYNFLSEVEAAYIVGDFGVKLDSMLHAQICTEPLSLTTDSWVTQGYPFYSGNMIYTTTFEYSNGQAILRLIDPSGTLFRVKVNGEEAGKILWRPYELDVTTFVKNGANELEITVVSSRQNTLGPLHEADGEEVPSGPGNFEEESMLREQYSLFDYGLIGGVEIVVRDV